MSPLESLMCRCVVLLASPLAACVREIPPVQACAGCVIQLQHVATLGSDGGRGAMASVPTNLARDSRGRFYVTTPDQGGDLPFVYNASGSFLQQLGREGEGPGEYRRPQGIIVTEGDTIHIFDSRTRRVTVLSPSYDLVRTAPGLPSHYDVARLANGDYVVNNPIFGFPLLEFDMVGQMVRRFGGDRVDDTRMGSWKNSRVLAVGRDRSLWSATGFFRYVIERWDNEGTKIHEITREPDWFPPYDSLWNPTPGVPPMPKVTGIWEDENGLLWVLGRAADPEWRNALGSPRRAEGRWVYPIEDYPGAYDGVIEVIDPEDGTLVASRRIDDAGRFMSAIEPGLIATRRETEDGWWLVDAWYVTLADSSLPR